ncbi:hypothetical protein LSH36_143g06033 [Paralvinella palmiformis]|uniref:Uncharacterized protein n=1 Tax=Paralvinella palmiformis TaxID=53620 RepID=A0AAD9JVG1_9ANNE|nr:hypothetical protein LSH36_143g06033 [Paralvinella palmiformis]
MNVLIFHCIQYHWQSLSYLAHLTPTDDLPEPFHLMMIYPGLLYRQVERLKVKQLHLNDLSDVPDDNIWHIGVVISSLLINSPQTTDQIRDLLLEWVESTQFKPSNQLLLLTCILCLLASMAWQCLYHKNLNNSWCELIYILWRKQTGLLVSSINNVLSPDDFPTMCNLLPNTTLRLLPAILCRVLLSSSCDEVLNSAHIPGLVECLLTLTVRCTQLYDGSVPQQDISWDSNISLVK